MHKVDHEVIIIGGGPAGSAAAMNLAQFGFDVCLVEKKIFPRETLCGEFLSGEVLKNMELLGIFRAFLSLKPNLIKSFKVLFENGKVISGALRFDAFAIKRSVLDSFLLECAKSNRVRIIQPAEVKEIFKHGEIFTLKIKERNSEEIVLKSTQVIAAYGKQNALDLSLNRPFSRIKTGFNGIKYQLNKEFFNSFDPQEIRIYTGKNIYCGINYVGDQIITLCFIYQRINGDGSFKEHLKALFDSNAHFKNIFKKENFDFFNEQKVYGTGNIYFGRRKKAENGILMVGDAAGVISPFSGDGIGIAFDSARLAAEVLNKKKETGSSLENASILYEKNWNKLFSGRMLIAKICQNFLLKSSLKKLGSPVLDIIHFFPSLNDYVVKRTRG